MHQEIRKPKPGNRALPGFRALSAVDGPSALNPGTTVLTRASEKPWFSQFEPALFKLFDFEFYLMKSVNRNLRFAVFLVFPKNGPLRRLLGICSCYDQLFFYISATLCAIFMTLAPKLWRPQWFEVG